VKGLRFYGWAVGLGAVGATWGGWFGSGADAASWMPRCCSIRTRRESAAASLASTAASVPLEAQSRFRRIQAYSQLPQLVNAMAALLDRQEAAA
jgi:hypothetical protein